MGAFHYERGDLNAALKCYVRTRDYCTTPQHIIDMCMNVIRVSLEMGNYAHVASYVAKAEQTPELTDVVTIAKLRAASGLAHLANRKYALAAKKFMSISDDLGNNFNEVSHIQAVTVSSDADRLLPLQILPFMVVYVRLRHLIANH